MTHLQQAKIAVEEIEKKGLSFTDPSDKETAERFMCGYFRASLESTIEKLLRADDRVKELESELASERGIE